MKKNRKRRRELWKWRYGVTQGNSSPENGQLRKAENGDRGHSQISKDLADGDKREGPLPIDSKIVVEKTHAELYPGRERMGWHREPRACLSFNIG